MLLRRLAGDHGTYGRPSNLINPEGTFEIARAEVAIAAMTTS